MVAHTLLYTSSNFEPGLLFLLSTEIQNMLFALRNGVPKKRGWEVWSKTWKVVLVDPNWELILTFTVPSMVTWWSLAAVIFGNWVGVDLYSIALCCMAASIDSDITLRLLPESNKAEIFRLAMDTGRNIKLSTGLSLSSESVLVQSISSTLSLHSCCTIGLSVSIEFMTGSDRVEPCYSSDLEHAHGLFSHWPLGCLILTSWARPFKGCCPRHDCRDRFLSWQRVVPCPCWPQVLHVRSSMVPSHPVCCKPPGCGQGLHTWSTHVDYMSSPWLDDVLGVVDTVVDPGAESDPGDGHNPIHVTLEWLFWWLPQSVTPERRSVKAWLAVGLLLL